MCSAEVMPRVLDLVDGTKWDEYDAVAIGPGMGQMEAVREMICEVLAKLKAPAVVDADALNAIAGDVAVLKKVKAPLVLTPHPGEMGRLTGKSTKAVQADRWGMAREFAREHKVTLVLKGAGSVVTDPTGKLWINSTGNPGMAKGGMGDALTGMIGALLARGMNPLDAARAGVFLHGSSGDMARDRLGEESMQASDLIGMIGEAVRALKRA
jgi:NAD(P)H-hydrate epimerase